MTTHQIALVTGANKGLGKEIARQLAQRGMSVALGSRDIERGEAAARDLRGEGLGVTALQLDVTDSASAARAAARLARDHGRLDVLVNNAGILSDQPALRIAAVDMRQTFEVNVFGVVTVIHALLPLLRASAAARIVNVSSTIASLALTGQGTDFSGTGNFLDYASSKAALNMLTLQYAQAFQRDGTLRHVKINSATPGYVATDINQHRGTRTVEEGARILVELATLAEDGPSGGFFNDRGVLAW